MFTAALPTLLQAQSESIFRRYAIQHEVTLLAGAAKLDAWTVQQQAKPKAGRKGQVRAFRTVKDLLKAGTRSA
jgi:hypothetical protein